MNDSNDTSSLINFNEIQQNLAETFNPETAKEKVKEIVSNMLLFMAVPFFAERLKSKIPEEAFTKIMDLLKDPDNLGKNSLEFAKQIFKDKFLEPIKNELLDKVAEEIPELRGIDLTKTSLSDIQKTITKGVIERMKANLPAEIADNLPENFSRDDILNAVKGLAQDKALAFAKSNLPPEAYAELERNQAILTDPAKISDFVKGKLNDVQSQVEENFNKVKGQVESRISEVKDAIKGKIDEATTEARGKIDQIKQAQSDARKAWNDTKSEFNDRFKTAQGKLDEFKSNNPNASADDLKPFEDEISNVKNAAQNAKESFFNSQDDLSTQLADAQGQVEQITNNLIQKVGNVRATITQRVQEVAQRGQQQFEDTKAAAQELQQEADTASQRVLAQPEVRAVSRGTMFQPTETEGGEASSIFDRMTSFVGEKASQFKQLIGRIGQQTPREIGGGNIQYEPKYTMLQADEPETTFSENAMRGVMKNPGLASYYGTENTPADQLLDGGNRTRILSYKPAGAKATKAPAQQQPAQPEQPQFTQEELRAAEQARISGQTAAPQKVLPTIQQAETSVEQTAPTQTTVQEQPQAQLGEKPPAQLGEAPKPTPEKPISAGEGDDIGQMLGTRALGEETGVASGDAIASAGAGEGVIGGLIAGLQEVPILDVLVDVGGILGSIFGAKALMKDKTPPPPIVAGSSYEPNL
jgi:hypothetical protein